MVFQVLVLLGWHNSKTAIDIQAIARRTTSSTDGMNCLATVLAKLQRKCQTAKRRGKKKEICAGTPIKTDLTLSFGIFFCRFFSILITSKLIKSKFSYSLCGCSTGTLLHRSIHPLLFSFKKHRRQPNAVR